MVEARLIVSPELAEFRAKLFDLQAIMQEELNEAGHWVMTVAIKKWKLEHVAQQLNIDWLQLQE